MKSLRILRQNDRDPSYITGQLIRRLINSLVISSQANAGLILLLSIVCCNISVAISDACPPNSGRVNCITYKDKFYSTLSDSPIYSNAYDLEIACNNNVNCSHGAFSLPSGWTIAPDESDSLNVIGQHMWSSKTVQTNSKLFHGNCSSLMANIDKSTINSSKYLLNDGFHVLSCESQLLIVYAPVICPAGSGRINCAEYNGRFYSTISDVLINGDCNSNCLSSNPSIDLPPNWAFAPDDSNTQYLITHNTWSSFVMATRSSNDYWTRCAAKYGLYGQTTSFYNNSNHLQLKGCSPKASGHVLIYYIPSTPIHNLTPPLEQFYNPSETEDYYIVQSPLTAGGLMSLPSNRLINQLTSSVTKNWIFDVTSSIDDGNVNSSACNPRHLNSNSNSNSNSNCDLRSAFDACFNKVPWEPNNKLSLIEKCTIEIVTGSIRLVKSLEFKNYSQITIKGNKSIVIYPSNTGKFPFITHNNTRLLGGSSLSIEGLTISSFRSGCFDIANIKSVFISQCIISNCSNALNGGALYISNVPIVNLINNYFDSNTALMNGGAIFIKNSVTISMESNSFFHSTSYNIGGAVVIDSTGSSNIINCIFNSSHSLNGFGGSLSIYNVTSKKQGLLIQNCLFYNSSSFYASSIVIRKSLSSNVTSCKFIRNVAIHGRGTVFWVKGSSEERFLESSNIFDHNLVKNNKNNRFNFVTQPLKLKLNSSMYEVTDYSEGKYGTPVILSAYVLDGFGQPLDGPDLSSDEITLQAKKYCGVSVSPGVFFDPTIIEPSMRNGSINQMNLRVICTPGGNISASLAVRIRDTFDCMSFPKYDLVEGSRGPSNSIVKQFESIIDHASFHFRHCLIGEKFDIIANKDTCAACTCSPCIDSYNFYSHSDLESIFGCNACPATALKCFGSNIILKPGTWRWNPTTTTIFDCPLKSGCLGGNKTGQLSCAPGYHGTVCGACDEGFYSSNKNGGSCLACSQKDTGITKKAIIIIFFISGLALFILLFFITRFIAKYDGISGATKRVHLMIEEINSNKSLSTERFRKFPMYFKLFIATYQILLQAPFSLQISFGPLFTRFVEIFRIINFDFVRLLPLQCYFAFHFVQSMVTTTLIPIVFSFVIVILFSINVIEMIILNYFREGNSEVLKRKLQKIATIFFSIIIFVTYMVLPGVSMKIALTFECVDLDPNREVNDGPQHLFLRADFAVNCNSDLYISGKKWAIFMLMFYPIGFPCLYFYLLYSNQKEIKAYLRNKEKESKNIKGDPSMNAISNTSKAKGTFIDGFVFLYGHYNHKSWYWEIVETTRRLMMTTVIACIYPGTTRQCIFGLVLALFYVKLISYFRPFVDPEDNVLAELGQYQIAITFLCSLIIKAQLLGLPEDSPKLYFAVDVCMVVGNIITPAYLMYSYIINTNYFKMHYKKKSTVHVEMTSSIDNKNENINNHSNKSNLALRDIENVGEKEDNSSDSSVEESIEVKDRVKELDNKIAFNINDTNGDDDIEKDETKVSKVIHIYPKKLNKLISDTKKNAHRIHIKTTAFVWDNLLGSKFSNFEVDEDCDSDSDDKKSECDTQKEGIQTEEYSTVKAKHFNLKQNEATTINDNVLDEKKEGPMVEQLLPGDADESEIEEIIAFSEENNSNKNINIRNAALLEDGDETIKVVDNYGINTTNQNEALLEDRGEAIDAVDYYGINTANQNEYEDEENSILPRPKNNMNKKERKRVKNTVKATPLSNNNRSWQSKK